MAGEINLLGDLMNLLLRLLAAVLQLSQSPHPEITEGIPPVRPPNAPSYQ